MIRNIEHFQTVDSTNAVLKRRIMQDKANSFEMAAVVAEEQTGGRGRRGRVWMNTEGALLMSIAVRLDDSGQAPLASIVAACAAFRTIRPYCPNARIKWPNDVAVAREDGLHKLCGILSELVESPSGCWFTVLGTGINVNCTQMPEGLMQPASSIFLETGNKTDLKVLSQALFDNTVICTDILRSDCRMLLREYTENCATINSTVSVNHSDGTGFAGVAEGVDELGRLLVRKDGELATVSAGDISIRLVKE